jgi:hypothetical protein
VRRATTITLVLLMVAILTAAVVQFFLLAR